MPHLAHIALVVRDYDEALAFYVGKLGFELVEDSYQPAQDKRWVVIRPPSASAHATTILLARAATEHQAKYIGDQAGGRVFLFLATDVFDRDHARFTAAGVTWVRPPVDQPYGRVAVFADLYGNLWDLVQFAAPADGRSPERSPAGSRHARVAGRDGRRVIEIRAGGLDDPRVQALIVQHRAEALGSTPAENAHAMDGDALRAPGVAFFAAWDGDELLGIAAVKEHAPGAGELKSMRTADAHLRRGVARALLDHAVAAARARGWRRLDLETGTAPMFGPANALYERYGFRDGPAFGGYPESPHNRFMTLAL